MTTLELHHLAALRAQIATWRKAGERIALVPTMGALHAGHISLVKAAQAQAKRVVVSIFVNPTQFGPNEDFSRYPRTLPEDLALLNEAGADAAWLPDVAIMYPQGFATSIHVSGVSEPMDGAARPGHFDGVATVVSKLLNQVTPDAAFFGEKDYQQLCVIRQLVADLNIPVTIYGVPTLREADGLAMSSRNRYLSDEERPIAAQLYATLNSIAKRITEGGDVSAALDEGIAALKRAGFSAVDYLELRDGQNLTPLTQPQPAARLLVAARLGTTRLIDNIALSL